MYAMLVMGGIKPENIIFMTYTTDLTDERNPFKGMIFTDPAETTDGDWAKSGCFEHVDYTNEDINPDVFLAILSGDADKVTELTGKTNPKVLTAGAEDMVISFFMDHGNYRTITVGGQHVAKDQLHTALKTAYDKKLFSKWLWVMEACKSGSMFEDLPEGLPVYAMTSADPYINAMMWNCPPEDDVIAGQSLHTCIAGYWDNTLMDLITANPSITIGDLYKQVKDIVDEESIQNPMEYGDKSFRSLPISDFIGTLPARRSNPSTSRTRTSKSGVPQDQVPLHLAKWRAIRANKKDSVEALEVLEALRVEVSARVKTEVEAMRLGASVLGEKKAHLVLSTPTISTMSFSASCVAELAEEYVSKCGRALPQDNSLFTMMRAVCLPGLSMPTLDWDQICM